MKEEDYLWVARDKDGFLYLFTLKPTKHNGVWLSKGAVRLNFNLFPNVKWEDEEPIPVLLQQALYESKNQSYDKRTN